MQILHWLAVILLIVGGLNWGLVGLLNLDLVQTLFGDWPMIVRTVYVLVGASAVWRLVDAVVYKK